MCLVWEGAYIPPPPPQCATSFVEPPFPSNYYANCILCSEQGSNTYEVSNQVQVSSLVPWVSAVLQLLQGMLELAQDFSDKVSVLGHNSRHVFTDTYRGLRESCEIKI